MDRHVERADYTAFLANTVGNYQIIFSHHAEKNRAGKHLKKLFLGFIFFRFLKVFYVF